MVTAAAAVVVTAAAAGLLEMPTMHFFAFIIQLNIKVWKTFMDYIIYHVTAYVQLFYLLSLHSL